MTSIERTAYPRLTQYLSVQELEAIYAPDEDELDFVNVPRSTTSSVLTRLVLLKTHQCLNYFPNLQAVPSPIVAYLRDCLELPSGTPLSMAENTVYRHHQAIRTFLGVKSYSDGGEAIIKEAMFQAAQRRSDPADLVNAAIENLIHLRRELPGFTTLNEWAQKIRTEVNQTWYTNIANRLSIEEQIALQQLLAAQDNQTPSQFVSILKTPGQSLFKEIRLLQERLSWLNSIVNTQQVLQNIPLARVKLFASEARALEARDFANILVDRRYTLLVCLIHQAKMETRNNLTKIFLKRMRRVHKKAKAELDLIRESQRQTVENMIGLLMQMAHRATHEADDQQLGQDIREILQEHGGAEAVLETCQSLTRYHDNNTLPLLWSKYGNHGKTIRKLLGSLDLQSTTPDDSLTEALHQLENYTSEEYIPLDAIALDFASQRWKRFIRERVDGETMLNRRHLEVCVMTYLSNHIQAGDVAVIGSEDYADYREQLLTWEACVPLLGDYCNELGFADNGDGFVEQLKEAFEEQAAACDQAFPDNGQLSFDQEQRPKLKQIRKAPKPAGATRLRYALQKKMPRRTVLDTLVFANHWLDFSSHFGPQSGSLPKIQDQARRYVMTVFGYGSNLGPEQTARHSRGRFTTRELALTNRQHISSTQLDAAIRDIINYYDRFDLPNFWGSGKTAAADGTVFNTYLNNLMAERHIRYGEYGGVAYHHVSDKYVALFSHFISVGVWEAVYIIDGLIENTSDIQPDTLHADTQGQSLTVFGISHLLGINLMPRIRNWKDLIIYRPDKDAKYEHIDSLFTDTIDWELIRTYWQEMMRVILSIRQGHLMPSTILRKLGNYSRQNSLYKAFRELGRVIRTMFLLKFVSDETLRRKITATTNKVESYNRFIEWIFFGGQGVITTNNPVEMEKRVKYNDLIASAIILLNVIDMTRVLEQLDPGEYIITPDTLATLSPYMTKHLQRFGDFLIDMETLPALPSLKPIALSAMN